MKQSLSLKLTALLIFALFAVKGFAESSDAEKLSQATDASATCVQTQDLKQAVINFEGDNAALNAQLAAYWSNDARREGNALKCLNGMGVAVENMEPDDESFTVRMKTRIQELIGTLGGILSRQDSDRVRINGPTVDLGIRG